MKVLIACEFSGVVREAFRLRGHDAWSCDFLPTDIPGQHIQGDVTGLLDDLSYDLIIAHPPCTDLCVSGARYHKAKWRDGRCQSAIAFFMKFINCRCPKVVVENPVGIMSRYYRKPNQIIQPWQFGHPESKSTCLWIRGLPNLTPTEILPKPECGYWQNQCPSGQNKLPPSADRWRKRSITYSGIAIAMAEQWG